MKARLTGLLLACAVAGCSNAPAPVSPAPDTASAAPSAPSQASAAPVQAAAAPVTQTAAPAAALASVAPASPPAAWFQQPTSTVPFVQPKGAAGQAHGTLCAMGAACMEQWGDQLPAMAPSLWQPPGAPVPVPGCEVSVGGASGTSTMQSNCDGLGTAYIYETSADDSHGTSLMETQLYEVAPAQALRPFSAAGGSVHFAVSMAVPVMTDAGVKATPGNDGSRAFVVWQTRWVDTTHLPTGGELGSGVEIGFGVRLATLDAAAANDHSCAYDPNSKRPFCNTAAVPGSPWIALDAGSTTFQTAPWSDMRPFGWSVSQTQFSAVLAAVHAAYPTLAMSLDPADWGLIASGPNPEIDFAAGPAGLAVRWGCVVVTGG